MEHIANALDMLTQMESTTRFYAFDALILSVAALVVSFLSYYRKR